MVTHRLFALALLLVGSAAEAQTATDSLTSPWQVARRAPGESFWAPLLRLRAAEDSYRASDMWWGAYAQYRAQMEASAGRHEVALGFWDTTFPARDSVGVLPEGVQAVEAVDWLTAVADTAQVFMINERHHAASDRLLTLRLLPALYARGFRYLAAEALGYDDDALNTRSYPVDATGFYTGEPVFGEMLREARRLGFTLVPYEIRDDQREADTTLTMQQRRDRAQAQNLVDAIFRDDPDAKVLVHAGFGHVQETVSERWYPMAVYFREISGIDPLTVDQTSLSERSRPSYEHPAYRAARATGLLASAALVLLNADGTPYRPARFPVDVQVLSPPTTDTAGRPDWMSLGGRRQSVDLALPECADRWWGIEARLAGEPDEAVPVDRTEVDRADQVRLFLPSGTRAIVRVTGADGTVLKTLEVDTE